MNQIMELREKRNKAWKQQRDFSTVSRVKME